MEKLNADLAIISKLGDNPGSDNGLSTEAFRAKFDEGAQIIQRYINEVLAPNVEAGSNPTAGLNMEGEINMNGNPIYGLPEPVEDTDAATKGYADSLHFFAAVVLPAAGWSESAPYKQTVAAAGIVETDRPIWGVVYSENNAIAEKEAFALVDDLDTADGSITFTCFEDKPEADLTIQLEVNR